MERVHLTGKLLVWAVVSVVPCYFLFLFASSSYRGLKQRHAKWIEAELAFKAAPTPAAADLQAEYHAARVAYNECRRTFWGAIWGTICRLPPAEDDGPTPG